MIGWRERKSENKYQNRNRRQGKSINGSYKFTSHKSVLGSFTTRTRSNITMKLAAPLLTALVATELAMAQDQVRGRVMTDPRSGLAQASMAMTVKRSLEATKPYTKPPSKPYTKPPTKPYTKPPSPQPSDVPSDSPSGTPTAERKSLSTQSVCVHANMFH